MPGLTLSLQFRVKHHEPARIAAAQDRMLHSRHYTAATRLDENGLYLGHVAYPEYPVRYVRCGDGEIAVEGAIYNKAPSRVDKELKEIAERIFRAEEDPNELVRRWILDTEGDFVVVIASSERGEVVAFNDLLGRLPLHYYLSGDMFLLAREAKFVQNLKPSPTFDPVGWAQFLWAGYPLGTRTLYEGVERAQPATVLHVRRRHAHIQAKAQTVYSINFEEKDTSGKTIEQYAGECSDILLSTTRRMVSRVGTERYAISLSGGKDSRLVASAVGKIGAPAVAVTCADAEGKAGRDVALAQSIAEALDLAWYPFDTPIPSQEDREHLAVMKDGLNAVDMTYMLSFLEQIADKWGRSTVYMTGDVGGLTFPDIRFRAYLHTMDEAVEALLYRQTLIAPEQAERIMRLAPGTITEEIRTLLDSYPEQENVYKAIHFVLYNRTHGWVFEGEDRARFFLREACPLASNELFLHCMSIPDSLKSYDALYRHVTHILSPEVAALPDANTGRRMTDPRTYLRKWMGRWAHELPFGCMRWARHLAEGRQRLSEVPESLLSDIRSGFDEGVLGQMMLQEATEDLAHAPTRRQMELLETLLLLEHANRG